MAEFDESRVREIVRDELSSKEIPERLKVIEEQNHFILETLKQKADKSDLEALRQEVKGDINTLREGVKGEINSLKAEIITKQDALRDLNKSNFRIIIGILLAILAVLIKNAFFS